MKTLLATSTLVGSLLLATATQSLAVSDGNYSPARMHCSGAAENSAHPEYSEEGCENLALTISDYAGHEYFGFGSPQTKEGEEGFLPATLPFGIGAPTHEIVYWYDLGPEQGGCKFTRIDLKTGQQTEKPCPWLDAANPNYYGDAVPPDPSSGLRIFFGADDNLAGGEHDSSTTVDNGPSDGGAVVLGLEPASLMRWGQRLASGDVGKLLTHPLALLDTGGGACADGICISGQSTRRDQTYPDGIPDYTPVANYEGHEWDPESCSGPSDDPTTDCGGKTIEEWNEQNGDPAVEPGLQVYEDPDAQGSPIGPYPLPAVYVGSCGVIIGGGDAAFPPTAPAAPGGPYINSAGQIIIPSGCDETAD